MKQLVITDQAGNWVSSHPLKLYEIKNILKAFYSLYWESGESEACEFLRRKDFILNATLPQVYVWYKIGCQVIENKSAPEKDDTDESWAKKNSIMEKGFIGPLEKFFKLGKLNPTVQAA
jgi:hypothetical protein